MGGKGSGRKRNPELEWMTPEQRKARSRAMNRERMRIKTESVKQAQIRAREKRKEYLKTEHGRAEYLSKKRVDRWWYGLSQQLKRSPRVRAGRQVSIGSIWIKAQFERQQGRCFYTGLPFVIDSTKRGMQRPSLDRIDPLLGYTPENTVLCLLAINYLKNDYRAEEVCELLWAIVEAYR